MRYLIVPKPCKPITDSSGSYYVGDGYQSVRIVFDIYKRKELDNPQVDSNEQDHVNDYRRWAVGDETTPATGLPAALAANNNCPVFSDDPLDCVQKAIDYMTDELNKTAGPAVQRSIEYWDDSKRHDVKVDKSLQFH